MKIIPYDTLMISTSDSLSVVLQRLNAKIEPPKILRFSTRHAPYQGTISEKGFKISRIINSRNISLPSIKGRFEVQPHLTLIHVQISINPFVSILFVLWCLTWVSSTVFAASTDSTSLHTITLYVGTLILMSIIFLATFWSQANESRHELSQIIQGEI